MPWTDTPLTCSYEADPASRLGTVQAPEGVCGTMPMHWLVNTVTHTVLFPMALYRMALFYLALYARVRLNIAAEDVALLLRTSRLVSGRCTCADVSVPSVSAAQIARHARVRPPTTPR